jgi:phosphoribosylanthranilate isomerase
VIVKICGVCREEDAALVAAAGATHIGVIVSARSPRVRGEAEAAKILSAAGDLVRVGVYVDAAPDEVVRSARRLALGVIQLHGSEAPDTVAAIRSAGAWHIWKAVRISDAGALRAARATWRELVDAVLVDGGTEQSPGGSGLRAPWHALAAGRWQGEPRLVLAGGLTPGNIAEAISTLRPDAVDVSSGVEAHVGVKDGPRVRAFIAAANAAHGAMMARNGG